MRRCLVLVLTILAAQANAAEEVADPRSEQLPGVRRPDAEAISPDSLISRDEWSARIALARKRAEQARRGWRFGQSVPGWSPAEAREKIATERVLNDGTLQPGDIVATDKGLFLFRGRPDGQPPDFAPLSPR